MTTKTAILIFSRSAQAEKKEKKFLPDAQANFNTARILIQEIQSKVNATGLPYFFIDESQQQGNTFGEKFAHAFQSIFDQGFNHVISVGNDSPNLTTHFLTTAVKSVQNGDLVLGPNWNDGVYLIGLSKDQFDASSFAVLPWQTSQIGAALDNYAYNQFLQPVYLEKLADINSEEDLVNYLHTTKRKAGIYKLLFALVFPEIIHVSAFAKKILLPTRKDVSVKRGPPTVFFSSN